MATATRKKKKLSRKAPPSGKGLTFEKVWVMMQETDRRLKEIAEEQAERQKETAKRLREIAEEQAERQKETERIMKENAERYEREKKENAERYEREKKENAERYEREKKEKAEQFEREMREIAERQAEQFEREKRERIEQQKENERLMKESDEKFKREMNERADRFDKQLGGLGNRFGEMVEYMVYPQLISKFQELGFEFTKAYHNAEIKDKVNNIFTEIDIALENGDKVMLVETKSKPDNEDITDHIKRIEKVKLHANIRGDNRTFLGAIGGIVFDENEKKFALKNGFYVIEPSGETFVITVPSGEYSPREW